MPNNSKLARLIDLVPFITSHQGISIVELSKKFGVTKEEIEKDLWLLYMCGLPGQTPLELMEFEFEDGFVTVRKRGRICNLLVL
jgi:proteasome accessory factor C